MSSLPCIHCYKWKVRTRQSRHRGSRSWDVRLVCSGRWRCSRLSPPSRPRRPSLRWTQVGCCRSGFSLSCKSTSRPCCCCRCSTPSSRPTCHQQELACSSPEERNVHLFHQFLTFFQVALKPALFWLESEWNLTTITLVLLVTLPGTVVPHFLSIKTLLSPSTT